MKKLDNNNYENYQVKSIQKQYFDKTHPNFEKFKLLKPNTICHNDKDYTWIHIMSNQKIAKDNKFRNFSFKVLNTIGKTIMYGIASKELYNDQYNPYNHEDFIGYYGTGTGSVYAQKKAFLVQYHGGGIWTGDTIQVKIDLQQNQITWIKNGYIKLSSVKMSKQLSQKALYPTLIMFNNRDTVELTL